MAQSHKHNLVAQKERECLEKVVIQEVARESLLEDRG